MEKFNLDLSDLEVQSFVTDQVGDVYAAGSSSQPDEEPDSMYPSCNNHSCGPKCVLSRLPLC